MTKKIVCIVLTLVMVLILVACGTTTAPDETATTAPDETATTAPDETAAVDDSTTDFPEMTLSYSVNYAETNVYGQGDKIMEQYIEEATGGKVTVDVYYSSSLLPQDQEIASMQSGDIDMCATGCSWLAEYIPSLKTLSGAYVFNSYEHWYKFYYESEAWAQYVDMIAEQTNTRVLAAANNGSRTVNLAEDKKVCSRADLEGVKLRMPGTEAWLFMGEALGANPVPVAYSDLYLSLQTGAVDGQDNPVASIKDQSFYEVTESVTLTKHVIADQWITIREDLWESLSPELQQIIQNGAVKACNYVIDTCHAQEAETIAFLEEEGLTVYELTDEELASFKQEVLDYYLADESVTADWDMDLLQAINDLS